MDNHRDEHQSTSLSNSPTASSVPDIWFISKISMTVAIIGLFFVYAGIASFLIYQHLETTKEKKKIEDKTGAALLADVLYGREQETIAILQSYASRTLFIAAVKQKNVPIAHHHLSELKKHHNIDLTFVTDKKGVLWINYPFFPESLGKDLSYRDWYKGISSHWAPYISEVFQLIVAEKPLAVAVCVPVLDEKGDVIGVLANSQRLEFLVNAIERIPFSPHTTVTVVDRTGDILYSNCYAYRDTITIYQHFDMFSQPITRKGQQAEDRRHKDIGTLYLTMVPVGDIGWSIIIERKLDDIIRSEFRRFTEIGGVALLMFVLSVLALISMRRLALFRKTKELLDARQKTLESEARYHLLFENALEGVYQSTPEGRLIDVNMAFANMYGYESPEEAVKMITDIAHQLYVNPDDREKAVSIFREVGYVKDFECQMRRKDGSEFWVHFNGRLNKTPDGAQILNGFILDITKRKQAEDEIIRLNEELEQRIVERTEQLRSANKELEAFTYSVSHDLRAPLRAVDGYVRILLDDFSPRLDDEGKRVCSVISESARSMGKLIDDLLAFSRIGRATMQFSPLDMRSMANSVFQELTTPESRARIDFNVGPLPSIPSDPSMMRHVWTNLLSNAIKFSSKKKHAFIEVGSEIQSGEVVYFIRDNGVGFNMKYSDKLFGVFQRLHSKRDFEGTGVGLAIVQRIIHRHGGRVWAISEMDKGATFYFSMKKGE